MQDYLIVLDRAGYEGINVITDESLRVVSEGTNRSVHIDPDGIEDFQSFPRVEVLFSDKSNLHDLLF